MIPDLDLARMQRRVEARNAQIPFDARDQIRYEIDVTDRAITELECRDRHLKFHEYDLAEPTPHIDLLIEEVKRDPTCIFWG